MRIEWASYAQEDRDEIFTHIEQESPQAAILVDDRIEEQVDQLQQYPEFGRPGRVTGTRELVINKTPFIVPYRILGNTVRVLRILHEAQLWPEGFEE